MFRLLLLIICVGNHENLVKIEENVLVSIFVSAFTTRNLYITKDEGLIEIRSDKEMQ